MKSLLAAAIAAALLTAASFAAAPPDKVFVDLETAWLAALKNHDAAALKNILAEDWSGQSDSAKRGTRASEMDLAKSGKFVIKSATIRDVRVRLIGSIAIVQGFDDETSSYDGKDSSGSYCWTDVFENRGGKWLAIASQVTKVKKSK